MLGVLGVLGALVTLGALFVWHCQSLETSPAQPALPPNLPPVANKAIFKIAQKIAVNPIAVLDAIC